MKRKFVSLMAAVAALLAFAEESAERSDTEIWNEGVSYYRAGDATNALRVLRPLLLSRTHGPRAAEIVAKLAYDAKDLEEAAVAAQLALRSSPTDARLNRNFTRAVDRLPEIRENNRIEAILKASQGKDPGELLRTATYKTRELMLEAAALPTNPPAKAVARSGVLSAAASTVADAWIPVRELITQNVTNQEQAATILQQISQAEEKSTKAVEELADLDPNAYGSLADVEHDCTRFLKLTILPPSAMDEGLLSQSNAWQDVEMVNGRPWQNDALDYTRAFRSKFPAWARAYEQQAQADTNKPPFSAEDQAKVSALATELEKLQIECTEKALPPTQEKALDLIRQIRDLLPKDGKGGGSNDQNQNQNQNQQQDQQQNKDQQDQKNEQQKNDQQQQNQPQKQEEKQEEKPEQNPEEEDQELEAVLKKAQERNDEHEADKKARMRKAPLSPNERDW